MKALMYTGKETLEFQDVPDPTLQQADDNLIEIHSVGICGSDMHAYLGHDARRPAPFIFGHEAAGIVLDGPMKGQAVTINPLVACGTCRACTEGRPNICPSRQIISMPPRPGAFAQKIVMPSDNLYTLPEGFSFDLASLAEPLAVCWHAVKIARNHAFPPLKDCKTLVIGGGAIGVGSALSLKAMGADDITLIETNAARADTVRRMLSARVTAPQELDSEAQSFDIVIDAVGFGATRATATKLVRPGGVIAHIGLGDGEGGLDIRHMTLQEITFVGTYTYTKEDFQETVDTIVSGGFETLDIMETRPLDTGWQAFKDIQSGAVALPKIVLRPL